MAFVSQERGKQEKQVRPNIPKSCPFLPHTCISEVALSNLPPCPWSFYKYPVEDCGKWLGGECSLLSFGGCSTILNWYNSPYFLKNFMHLRKFLAFFYSTYFCMVAASFPGLCHRSKVPLFHPSLKELISPSLEFRLLGCLVIPALWDAPRKLWFCRLTTV